MSRFLETHIHEIPCERLESKHERWSLQPLKRSMNKYLDSESFCWLWTRPTGNCWNLLFRSRPHCQRWQVSIERFQSKHERWSLEPLQRLHLWWTTVHERVVPWETMTEVPSEVCTLWVFTHGHVLDVYQLYFRRFVYSKKRVYKHKKG